MKIRAQGIDEAAVKLWSFSQGGRKLANLPLDYETAEPYMLNIDSASKKLINVDYLELFQRMVAINLEAIKVAQALPNLDIASAGI